MPKPSDYVVALCYGVANHQDSETVLSRQHSMAAQNAPLDACYFSHTKNRWITLGDFPPEYEIVAKVKLLLTDMEARQGSGEDTRGV